MKKFLILMLICPCIICKAQLKPQMYSFDTGIRAIKYNDFPEFGYTFDNYLQYSPAAIMVGLKAFGYESRSSWGRMLVSDAFTVGAMAIAVNGIKYSVRRMRPDGSARNSFPSGHTATAFMVATMLHKEYGWRSPWFSFGGYALSSVTAISRIINDRHWMTDTFAGAVIGIAATHLGYFLSDLIFKDKYLSPDFMQHECFFDPQERHYDIGLYFAERFVLNGAGDPGYKGEKRGSTAGVQIHIPIIPNTSVTLRAGANSLIMKGGTASYNIYNVLAGGYWNYPFAKILEVGATALAGCAFNGNTAGFDGIAGISLGVMAGNNFKIKAFSEYETFCRSVKQKPSYLHSALVGAGAAFVW